MAEFLLARWTVVSSVCWQRVYAVTFCGRRAVRKERFKKEYRHPALDERLTTRRLQGVRCGTPPLTVPAPALARRHLSKRAGLASLAKKGTAPEGRPQRTRLCSGSLEQRVDDGPSPPDPTCLQEARNLVKARKLGVRTPTLYAVDLPRRTLTMERISGTSMKDLLLSVTHSLRQQHHHHHQQQQQQQQQAQEQWGGAVMDPSGTNEISKVPLWGLEVARGIPP